MILIPVGMSPGADLGQQLLLSCRARRCRQLLGTFVDRTRWCYDGCNGHVPPLNMNMFVRSHTLKHNDAAEATFRLFPTQSRQKHPLSSPLSMVHWSVSYFISSGWLETVVVQ